MRDTRKLCLYGTILALVCGLAWSSTALADGGITFTNVADDEGSGITFERVPSERNALEQELLRRMQGFGEPISPSDFFNVIRNGPSPLKPRGAPGVALFDYDGDGDLDIYATNGPGGANPLYSNQFKETGEVTFIDVAAAAGVTLTDRDNTGVCFGDIDNDGDHDFAVLALGAPNALFENQGDGTFVDIAVAAGTAGDGRNPTSCGFADFNLDGYLDLVVANTYPDWSHRDPFGVGPTYPNFEHNQLYINTGGNVFADMSAASGIENNFNMDYPGLSGGSHSWALAAYDHDEDGDTDILFADNQFGAPTDETERRGYLRFFDNDGTGNFVENTETNGLEEHVGGWMGIAVGDWNCDTYLDFFATDTGFTGRAPSVWFNGTGGGNYELPGLGDLAGTPFGWGTSAFDYDNDGDSDIMFHGSIDLLSIIFAENPGSLLQNVGNCSGQFDYDAGAIETDHAPRMVEGMAVGDLNNDGFEDMVSVSGMNVRPFLYFPFVGVLIGPTGSPFDPTMFIEFTLNTQTDPVQYIGATDDEGNIIPHPNGDMTVELSSGPNGNRWLTVEPQGSHGLIADGSVNRDGIGAVVTLRTARLGLASKQPVLGGSSYQSQDSLLVNAGLGLDRRGLIEILWPGGTRNRLYNARLREQVVFPEIPCNIATEDNFIEYIRCAEEQIDELQVAGVLDSAQGFRYFASAVRGYFDYRAGR